MTPTDRVLRKRGYYWISTHPSYGWMIGYWSSQFKHWAFAGDTEAQVEDCDWRIGPRLPEPDEAVVSSTSCGEEKNTDAE